MGEQLIGADRLKVIADRFQSSVREGKRTPFDEWGFPDGSRQQVPTYEWTPRETAPLWIGVREGSSKWLNFIVHRPPRRKVLTPLFEFNIPKRSDRRGNFRFYDRP